MQQNNTRTVEVPGRSIDTRRRIMKCSFRYTMRILEREAIEVLDTVKTPSIEETVAGALEMTEQVNSSGSEQCVSSSGDRDQKVLLEAASIEAIDRLQLHSAAQTPAIETIDSIQAETSAIDTINTRKLPVQPSPSQTNRLEEIDAEELLSPPLEKDIPPYTLSKEE